MRGNADRNDNGSGGRGRYGGRDYFDRGSDASNNADHPAILKGGKK
jgi:hypothetical protein